MCNPTSDVREGRGVWHLFTRDETNPHIVRGGAGHRPSSAPLLPLLPSSCLPPLLSLLSCPSSPPPFSPPPPLLISSSSPTPLSPSSPPPPLFPPLLFLSSSSSPSLFLSSSPPLHPAFLLLSASPLRPPLLRILPYSACLSLLPASSLLPLRFLLSSSSLSHLSRRRRP